MQQERGRLHPPVLRSGDRVAYQPLLGKGRNRPVLATVVGLASPSRPRLRLDDTFDDGGPIVWLVSASNVYPLDEARP